MLIPKSNFPMPWDRVYSMHHLLRPWHPSEPSNPPRGTAEFPLTSSHHQCDNLALPSPSCPAGPKKPRPPASFLFPLSQAKQGASLAISRVGMDTRKGRKGQRKGLWRTEIACADLILCMFSWEFCLTAWQL